MDLDSKIVAANIIAEVLRPKEAYVGFSSKPKNVQYGIIFAQEVNGLLITDHYTGDDGLHIVGLVRHRLNNPAPTNVTVSLP